MSPAYDVKKEVLSAFRSLISPLVRILLRSGVSYREFAEVVKDIYVSIAARESGPPSGRMTLARLAVVTGLTRKEITSIIRDERLRRTALETEANRAARVLELWHSDQRYMGPYGFPRDLLVKGNEAESFEQLVAQLGGDISSQAMLEELVRVGAAKLVDGGRSVRVLKRTYIPTDMTPEMIQIFIQSVRRYMQTVDYNLSLRRPQGRRFERTVYPDFGLRPQDVPAFQQEVREYLETVIAELVQMTSRYPEPDLSRGEEAVSLGVGIYVYQDEPEDERTIAEVLGRREGLDG